MAETSSLGLPLVDPAQAQKHVTVNEAFARLDALVQLHIEGTLSATPPANPSEGEVHAVPEGASAEWTGQAGSLAVFVNGGWSFVTPKPGWQAWSVPDGTSVIFDGAGWTAGAGAMSRNGAGFVHRTREIDHELTSGPTSMVVAAIPPRAIVYGITGRVVSAIGGASSFSIGVSDSSDRYGGGIGTGIGSWASGITSSPLTYYVSADIVLTASGGVFDGTGMFRLAVHYAELTLPRG